MILPFFSKTIIIYTQIFSIDLKFNSTTNQSQGHIFS
jgi:hypothetical protein